MKKSKKMSAGLVALLLVTCVAAGSIYARYTVNRTGSDSARVAKFEFNLNGATTQNKDIKMSDLFSTSYYWSDVNGSWEVAHRDGDTDTANLVAPGTVGRQQFTFENFSEVPIELVNFTLTETQANYAVTGAYVDENGTAQDATYIPMEYKISKETDFNKVMKGAQEGGDGVAWTKYNRSAAATTLTTTSNQVSAATSINPGATANEIATTPDANNTVTDSRIILAQDDSTVWYLYWRWAEYSGGEDQSANDTALGAAAYNQDTAPTIDVAVSATVRQHIPGNEVDATDSSLDAAVNGNAAEDSSTQYSDADGKRGNTTSGNGTDAEWNKTTENSSSDWTTKPVTKES